MKFPYLKPIITALLIMGLLALGIFFFRGQNHLKKARHKISSMQQKIKGVEDSLEFSKERIEALILKMEKAENQINTLKTEREMLEIEIKKDQATTRKELEAYKIRLGQLEARHKELLEEAKKFDL